MVRQAAGSVSREERRQARLQDRDRSRLQRIGIDASRLIGDRIQRAVFKAGDNSDRISQAVRAGMRPLIQLLTEGMTTAHLAGHSRSRTLVPKEVALALFDSASPYNTAVRVLEERLKIKPERLTDVELAYDVTSIRVVQEASDAVERKLQESILESTRSGATVKEGKASLRRAFTAAGISPQNSFTLEAIFRTQTQLAYNAGWSQADSHPALQEILWGYKYVTVGDDRVRDEHVGFEGVTLPKDDPFWNVAWPPNGWACRCAVISIYEQQPVVPVPDTVDVDGEDVAPQVSRGFRFNPGQFFANAQ